MKKTSKAEKRNIIGARVRQARLKSNPAVSQDDLAGKLAGRPGFGYLEIAGGNHDAPLLKGGMIDWLRNIVRP